MNIIKKFLSLFRKKEVVQNPDTYSEVEALRNFGNFQSMGGVSHEKKEVFGLNVHESDLNEK